MVWTVSERLHQNNIKNMQADDKKDLKTMGSKTCKARVVQLLATNTPFWGAQEANKLA